MTACWSLVSCSTTSTVSGMPGSPAPHSEARLLLLLARRDPVREQAYTIQSYRCNKVNH